MQLSPSIVPSDSNALAGIFPAGGPVAAAEGPGLAEPAGFADLMAALAPALDAATPIAVQSQPAGFASRSVAMADLRAPSLAQVEGVTAEVVAVAGVDAEIVSTAGEGSEAAPLESSPCTESSREDGQPVDRPRVREPRRSLHEPVAGLETMIVPQVMVAPTPLVEDDLEFDEEPAELDTEEAPLDEHGSSREDTAEDITLPVERDAVTTHSPAFTDVEPQREVTRAPLHDRRAAAPVQSPVSALPAQAASSEPTSLVPRATASAIEAMGLPRAEAKPEQGTAKLFVTAAAIESAANSISRRPVATPTVAPATVREAPAPEAPVTSEATFPSIQGPASGAQLSVEVLTRATAAAQPVKAAAVEVGETIAADEAEVSEQVLPVGNAVAAAVLAPMTQREAASRPAGPRVAAVYATREKIAAERMAAVSERFSQNFSANISFLSADNESVETDGGAVGIDVAKPNALMPALSSPATFAALAPVVVSVQDVASLPVQAAAEISASAAVSNAEQAVEVVLRAVDTAADREQKIVKLEFSVGDADLSVHVELAANEVRTTFRTESPELRAALAQEWGAVSIDSIDEGGPRLAPAVIADKEQSSPTSADANSQRQERHAARQEEGASSAHQAAARSLLRASTPADATAAATPAFRPLAPAGTAQRLHLFA